MIASRRKLLQLGAGLALASKTRSLWAADKPGMTDVAAGPDHLRQRIDGFGFCEAFHAANTMRQLAEDDRAQLLNLMFSPNGGMGYSMLRVQIGDAALGNPGAVATIEPKDGEFQWAGDEDQIWLMNEARKRGCTRFLASSWSPPAWMKTNGNSYAGELRPTMYQKFADYLATYVLEYKSRYGLDIYALSPQNEPNFKPTDVYASCLWTADQMTKFLRDNLIPTFAAKTVPAQIVVDEHANWSEKYIKVILSDSACKKALNIVGAHAYAATTGPYMPFSLRTGPFTSAMDAGKRIWQTEVSAGDANITNMNDGVYWARVIHQHMTEDNVSAWLYWWGAARTKTRGTLISVDTATKKLEFSKRFFTIGQFARFIRPGFHRVDANPSPAPNTFFSAYLSPDGKQLVCVAINDDAVEHPLQIAIGGFSGTRCVPVRTSNTETHTRLAKIDAINGEFSVTTSPLSVTTYVIT